MSGRRLELRNIPASLVRERLEHGAGGVSQPDGSIEGAGWRVRLEEGAPVVLRPATVVPVLFVHIEPLPAANNGEGRDVETIAAFIVRQTLRGGG